MHWTTAEDYLEEVISRGEAGADAQGAGLSTSLGRSLPHPCPLKTKHL